jgi:hypothetical protein
MTHSSDANDNIDKLPLSMIQLQSNTLKSAQLVKNSQMETMLELHSDSKTGSLQIRPQDIAQNFKISAEDQATIDKLSTLKSYDIYSLRGNLQKLGIQVDEKALELSDEMKGRLNAYAQEFTRPLIANIFGDGSESPDDKESLQKIFRSPDVRLVQARLKIMSTKTGIPVEEIPTFLKNYADLFQSGAYYRHSYENVGPDIHRFWNWLGDLKGHREVCASQGSVASCKKVEDSLTFLCGSIDERLNEFRKGFEAFWGNMNKKSFERLRRQVEGNHTSMGAVLCGVTVKMRDWSKTFPDNNTGGTQTRIKHVSTKMEPGLEQLRTAENNARLMAAQF